WDCKGSNDFDIVKNLFLNLFLFVCSGLGNSFAVSGKRKKRHYLTPFQPFKSFFFILFTVSLPPKRSANVEENFRAAKQ
ncbi:hypothetical protein ACTHQF_16760, partial [Pedobacter sp. SAFR-022]|uniref:hypothetical protein n=1 Tax=Pedobacter sp. SAFR-022 TaxID=3436861 RepID=UPI003F7E4E5B